jgi:hypothetical protein
MPLPALRCLPFPACPPSCRDYTRLDPRLHFLDCGDRFLTQDQRAIDAGLMPDALHPSAPGYELLAQCLDPLVTKLVQRPLAAERATAAAAGAAAAEDGMAAAGAEVAGAGGSAAGEQMQEE